MAWSPTRVDRVMAGTNAPPEKATAGDVCCLLGMVRTAVDAEPRRRDCGTRGGSARDVKSIVPPSSCACDGSPMLSLRVSPGRQSELRWSRNG
jgi:hypothetical protein